ncbi:hypothetical protein B484DRAFT_394310 [Ochromonadaceae sp. CCMP2298]|nr:hypothetical protein B484DRAFT_394310 [Ochromonadaceae sp. CCMP2298]
MYALPIILLTPVVLLKELRQALLLCDTAAQLTLTCRTQQALNMTSATKLLLEFLRNTPPKYFAAVSSRHMDGKRLELGNGQVTEELHLNENDEARENLALSSGRPLFPLPAGRYPTYDGYPTQDCV